MNSPAPSRHRRTARPTTARLLAELLEDRNLLDGGLANVLVNDPNLDVPVFFTPGDPTTFRTRDTQSETTIVLVPGNEPGAEDRVVVAYNDSGSEIYFNGRVEGVGYSLSTDGGDSFEDRGTPPPDTPYGYYSDPVLARSSSTGTIFLGTIPRYVKDGQAVSDLLNVSRSVDNGFSFELPQNAAPGFVAGVDDLDKPWLAVDNYPGPGYGNIYLTWRNFSLDKARDGILLTRSTDDGLTWGPNGGIRVAAPAAETQPGPPSGNGAFVTVGPDHAVYVMWWDKAVRMRKSTDFGETFGPTVTVANLRRQTWDLGIDGFRVLPFYQMAVNPANGQVYVVYHDNGHGKDKSDAFFRQSNDGGMTWGPEVRLNDDATVNDQWSPALAVTPDGSRVGVFWYDRRLDAANHMIDRYGVTGTVSGGSVSFGPNFRVTDQAFPPVYGQDTGGVGPTYMGDYDQAVADNGHFYITWGDNRLANPNYAPHVNQPDVRFAKVPVDWGGSIAAFLPAGAAPAADAPARHQPPRPADVQPLAPAPPTPPANAGSNHRGADDAETAPEAVVGTWLWLDDAGRGQPAGPATGDDRRERDRTPPPAEVDTARRSGGEAGDRTIASVSLPLAPGATPADPEWLDWRLIGE